jgi:hypothetical protein
MFRSTTIIRELVLNPAKVIQSDTKKTGTFEKPNKN